MNKLSLRARKFKFVERSKIWFAISGTILLVGIILLCTLGMNLGIDFTGGAEVSVEIDDAYAATHQAEIDTAIQEVFAEYKLNPESAQFSSIGDGKSFEYKFQLKVDGKKVSDKEFTTLFNGDKNDDTSNGIVGAIQDKILAIEEIGLDADENFVYYHAVTGSASADLIKNTFLAVAIAAVLILIYIAFRFTFSTGLAAVVCLLHDVCIMVALAIICRIQVNASFVAACITIIGYSINATIVIFDRVRENSKSSMFRDASPEQIANTSIAQTMTRSLYTTLTTMFTIVALAFIPSLRDFALPIVFGLLAGAYSSIFLSASLWVAFTKLGKKLLKEKNTYKGKKKAQAKSVDPWEKPNK